jgi:hypothetical protein
MSGGPFISASNGFRSRLQYGVIASTRNRSEPGRLSV